MENPIRLGLQIFSIVVEMVSVRKTALLLLVLATATVIIMYVLASASSSGVVRGTLSPLGRGVMASFYSEALYQGIKLPEAYIVHEMLYQPIPQTPVATASTPPVSVTYIIAGILSSLMLSEVIERSVH